MVNRRNVAIAAAAALVVIGLFAFFYKREERKVKKVFSKIEECFSKGGQEAPLEMVQKAAALLSLLAPSVEFSYPSRDISTTVSRDDLARQASGVRTRYTEVELEFQDLAVEFPADGEARVLATARLTGRSASGEEAGETHEVSFDLKKTEGKWLLSGVEIVDVLEK